MKKGKKITAVLVTALACSQSFSAPIVCSYEKSHIDTAISALTELEGYTDFWQKYIENNLSNTSPLSEITTPLFIEDNLPKIAEEIAYDEGVITILLKDNNLKIWAVDNKYIRLTPITADSDGDGNDETLVSWNCETTIKAFSHYGKKVEPMKQLKQPLSNCAFSEDLEAEME